MLERTAARLFGERPEPDWTYVAENPDGIPVRGAQGTIGLGDRDALLARVRAMLAHVFAPLSSDLLRRPG